MANLTRPGTGLLIGTVLAASITTTTLSTYTKEDTDRADHCETITWQDDPAAWELAMAHGLATDDTETLYNPANCPLEG